MCLGPSQKKTSKQRLQRCPYNVVLMLKASNEVILQNICSWVWSPGKSYLFLQNFEKALLENLICSYGIYFFLLENLMCSNEILDKISWKIWSVLRIFSPPRKSYVFLQNFKKALLKILMCSSTFYLSWKI